MPVIKPILSFTLFLLLRRGVLFFIREKIYMLKAPCSRNKHDFGRTFQKTVCRRLSVRQSCGACVAVQGRERGRTRRFHRTSRGGIRGRRGEQAPFRRRSFGVAGFGELRADLRRFAVETRVRHLEGGTCADGRCAACGRGERGGSRGSDGGLRRGPCMRDDMFPKFSGGLAVKTGRHVDVAAGDVDAFGLHAGKTGAVGQDDVVAFRPSMHDDGSPGFRASFACDAVEGRRSSHEMSRACCLVAGGTSARASHEREKARRHVPDGPFPRRETLQKMFLRIRRLRPGSARRRVCVYACDGPRRRG